MIMKALKKFFVLLVSAILSLGVCLFGSCSAGGGSSSIDDSDKYVIYVMKDGEGVEGVKISLCEPNGQCLTPADTDENGLVIFEGAQFPVNNYHITVVRGLPAGYTAPDVHTGTSYGTFTIELVAE